MVAAASLLLSCAQLAAATRSSVRDGRLVVDDAPFFMIGTYVHDLNATDWDTLAAAGLNTCVRQSRSRDLRGCSPSPCHS